MATLYLKYRPQSFSELIGQESVKKVLEAAATSGKLSHAYLLVGPRGTGKTSTARILAKMINCKGKGLASRSEESGKGEIPCNKCETCISITDGSNLDLIEIDAASNRGIDDIRSLRETIKVAPTSSKKKVYIIDEVHMLTTEAFNALLKTLEEPPSHVLFILATTEVSKVPQTILSRVTRLEFKLATTQDLLVALKRVASGEGMKVDDEILKIIAKKADGSFRDGVKYLDQLAAAGEITKESVESLLQSGDFNSVVGLLESLSDKDTTKSLSQVISQTETGTNVKNTVMTMIEILRDLVFINSGLGIPLVAEEYGSEKYEVLKKLAEKFSNQELVRDLEILQEATENLKTASIPSLPLELAIVEICEKREKGEGKSFDLAQDKSQKLEEQKLDVGSDLPAGKAGKIEKEIRSSKLEENPTSSSNIQVQDPASNFQRPTSNTDISKLQEKWTFVLETIRQYNYSLEALLRSVKIADCNGTMVLLEVPYSFHQRILEAPKSRDVLESILSDILSRPIKVSTVLGTRPQRIEDIANVEVAADDEIISMASDIFNGKLVD